MGKRNANTHAPSLLEGSVDRRMDSHALNLSSFVYNHFY